MKMNYWLVKSEPDVYPWDQFVKEGTAVWSGVRNYAARLHMIGMREGDLVLFYHSMIGHELVGIAKVTRESYPDPITDDARWVAVDLAPVKALKHPVSLSVIKADKRLKNTGLVRIGRLSVMPLTKEEYDTMLELGAGKGIAK